MTSTVLIVDDEYSGRETLQSVLEGEGYRLEMAENGWQAIEKANQFKFDLNGAVLASDAFFPFNDCVQIAHAAGIASFIQPGGSVRDKDSIEYCVQHNLAMVITGMRHFRH